MNIKPLLLVFLTGVMVCIVGLAQAATYTETFGGVTVVDPDVSGVTTVSDWVWADEYGPPNITLVNDEASDFPQADTDSQYLKWEGNTDQYLHEDGTGLSNTGAPIQIAIPLVVYGLDSLLANNTVDIIFVNGTGGSNFGVTCDAGLFRMAGTNNFNDPPGQQVILSTTAFDPAAGNNWADGEWRILAGRVSPSVGGSGTAKWWEIDPDTGDATVLVDASGLTNDRDGSDVDWVGYGASLAAPAGTANLQIAVDNVSFYSTDEFATEAAFLAAVRSDYTNYTPPTPTPAPTPSSAELWMYFE